MSEMSTSEPDLAASGIPASAFWAAPVARVPEQRAPAEAQTGAADDADRDDARGAGAEAAEGSTEAATPDTEATSSSGESEPAAPDAEDESGEPDPGEESDPSTLADEDEVNGEEADGEDAEGEDAEGDQDEGDEDEPEEVDVELELRRRFEELVDERLRRARYGHHLTRAVFTPAELVAAEQVERRAAVWVPTMTFLATAVSAVAAVVLATRLRSDPADPGGNQLLVVTVTVCLLAAAFATLLRAEVHYQRLRPTGRVVRHDVADAYELVRDAPRRLAEDEVPLPVLRRVVGLLPTAEQLVSALAAYISDGGTRVRAHPAYERILRMRAEVEALEVMLEEGAQRGADPVPGVQARLPRPEQVADYDGLADLAATLGTAP